MQNDFQASIIHELEKWKITKERFNNRLTFSSEQENSMPKCSECGSVYQYAVENWDSERGGAWWAYNPITKMDESANRDGYRGFKTLDQAEKYYETMIKNPYYSKVRIRKILIRQLGENIVKSYSRSWK